MNKEIVELIGGGDQHVSRLSIIASRPTHGKTRFALDVAMEMAADPKKNVVFVTLESNIEDLNIVNPKVSNSNVKILEAPNICFDELLALIDAYNPCSSYTTVFVDNLQSLIDYSAKEGVEAQTSNIISRLKQLSFEMTVNIVLLSQLNRGIENRENKRPQITDLRESGNIEAMADLVLLLYREHVYTESVPEDMIEVNVAKNRFGKRGVFKLGE